MAFLTSYTYKGVELNNGTSYAIPRAGTAFDDPNPTDASWAYRKGDTPVQTGVTVKEGVFVVPIHIIATTSADYAAKLKALKVIFNTRDDAHYAFYRKLPHESVYSWVMASPRQFVEDPAERKVVVTMQTPDRAWTEPTLQTATQTLFDTGLTTEDIIVNYTGATPVEPIITVQCLTEGHDGPRAMYYHYIYAWTQGAQHIVGEPLLLVDNWNTSAMVTASEIRADGLDITVETVTGTPIPRYVCGTAADRRVWIQPTAWPMRFDVTLQAYPEWNPLTNDPMLAVAHTAMYVTLWPSANPDNSSFTTEFPAAATVYVDDEAITYSGVTWLNDDHTLAKLTITARGALGTTATDHYAFRRVLMPTLLMVRYGYPPPYEYIYTANNLAHWPLIDYNTSTNSLWSQTNQMSPWVGAAPIYRYGWEARSKIEPSNNKRGVGETIRGHSTFGATVSNRISPLKLVGRNSGSWNTNPPSFYQRLTLHLNGSQRGRVLSFVRFYTTLNAGSAAGRMVVRASVIRANFGAAWRGGYSDEQSEVLWAVTKVGNTPTASDTDWLYLNAATNPVAGVAYEVHHVAPGTGPTDNVVVTKIDWLLDQEWGGSPIGGTIGGQFGGSQVALTSIRNLSDAQVGTAFTLNTLMGVSDIATIDCALRTVSGALLKEVAYANPTWLRLLPGSNTIRVSGSSTVGRVQFTVKWYNKN